MNTDQALFRFAKDTGISADDIKPEFRNLTVQQALIRKNEIDRGEYISIPNKNNLSETLIYRRTKFNDTDDAVLIWDGVSKDRTWYEDHIGEESFYISNPNQLAAFADIVAEGVDFKDKTIKILSNINLNKKQWTPIGHSTGTFRGIFDGDGHGIYNLSIRRSVEDDTDSGEKVTDNRWLAFFNDLAGATIKDVIFEHVHINDTREERGGVAAVAATATDTIFANICTSGIIIGNICSSMVLYAVDSTFYNCINRANIYGKSFVDNDKIVVGGLVSELVLSDSLCMIAEGRPIKIFERCYQEGVIQITVRHNLEMLAAGQLYGEFSERELLSGEKPASFTIDRCLVSATDVRNLNEYKTSKIGLFGRVDGDLFGKNFADPVTYKGDMLEGLIGRTPISVGVTIIRPTMSSIVRRAVIPGSLNTLKSNPYVRNFVTDSTAPIDSSDGIVNMAPYYSYIKRVSI